MLTVQNSPMIDAQRPLLEAQTTQRRTSANYLETLPGPEQNGWAKTRREITPDSFLRVTKTPSITAAPPRTRSSASPPQEDSTNRIPSPPKHVSRLTKPQLEDAWQEAMGSQVLPVVDSFGAHLDSWVPMGVRPRVHSSNHTHNFEPSATRSQASALSSQLSALSSQLFTDDNSPCRMGQIVYKLWRNPG